MDKAFAIIGNDATLTTVGHYCDPSSSEGCAQCTQQNLGPYADPCCWAKCCTFGQSNAVNVDWTMEECKKNCDENIKPESSMPAAECKAFCDGNPGARRSMMSDQASSDQARSVTLHAAINDGHVTRHDRRSRIRKNFILRCLC
jgi:hypothetical protein